MYCTPQKLHIYFISLLSIYLNEIYIFTSLIVSRSEKDLVQIKEAFEKAYSKTLEDWITDDTGGDFKSALLAVVSGEVPQGFSAPPAEPEEPPEWIDATPFKLDYTQTGTIKDSASLDASADAAALRKAMKGFGTDEDKIIEIICARSNSQRQQIADAFKTAFGRDLLKDLESELTGKLETIILGLMDTNVAFDAKQVKKAVKGLGTDDDCLVEVLCTRTNEELQAVKGEYEKMFGKSMETDVKDDTSGIFQKLLVSIMNAARDEDKDQVDAAKCRKDAKVLFDSGEGKLGDRERISLCSKGNFIDALF